MRARRRRDSEEDEENSERWTVSYMDMVTVIMCLFIVLFAMSHLDQQKFTALRESLAGSFGRSSADLQPLEGGSGVLEADAPAPDVPDGAPAATQIMHEAQELRAAQQELEELNGLREAITADLAEQGLQEEVTFRITDRGLVVGLVSEHVFFSPASAEMSATARQVIDTMAVTLAGIDHDLSLEGHANVLPGTDPYPTNWELSADRATKVLRRFVEHGGIAPQRTHAVGFGDAHPLVTEGPDALAINRRVDVVIASDQPEGVRTLMPELAETAKEG